MEFKVIQSDETLCVMANVPGAVCDCNQWDKKGHWNIARVFVRPSLRRKGVGKALLNLLFKKLHSLGAEWVDVAPGGYDLPQEQQYAFYSSCGFEHDPKQEGRMVYYFKI